MHRVLILEPDSLIRNLMINALEVDGLSTTAYPTPFGDLHQLGANELGSIVVGDGGGGFEYAMETVIELKRRAEFSSLPILVVANNQGRTHFDAGQITNCIDAGVDYLLAQPFTISKFVEHVRNLSARKIMVGTSDSFLAQHVSLHLEQFPSVLMHGQRVGMLAADFARWLELDDNTIETVRIAGVVHDVGKIGVPRHILTKPSALTEVESALMNRHAEYGAKLCANFGLASHIVEAVRYHHERHDGSGTPYGLKGVAINPSIAIVSLADAFDALCENRAYRAALTRSQAVRILKAETERGIWNPTIANKFFQYLEAVLEFQLCGGM